MSPVDVVLTWKNAERRGDRWFAGHPAGEIAPVGVGGNDPVGTYTGLCWRLTFPIYAPPF